MKIKLRKKNIKDAHLRQLQSENVDIEDQEVIVEIPDVQELDSKYQNDYSVDALWEKVKAYGSSAGKTLIISALTLYYVLESGKLDKKQQTLIVAVLGYFILPIDIIPDIVPIVGYMDDGALLLAALRFLGAAILDDTYREKATQKYDDLFNDDTSS